MLKFKRSDLIKKYHHTFVVTVTLLLGGLINLHDYKTAEEDLRSQLLEHATILSGAIDINLVKSLTGTEADLTKYGYKRLKEQLSFTLDKTPNTRFIYLMGKRDNGELFFLVDSEKETSKDYSPPGQVYEDASVIDNELFTSKTEAVQGPDTDSFGTFVTASVAITDPDSGNTVAVLGIDVEAVSWQSKVLNQCISAFGINCFVVCLLLAYFMHSNNNRKVEEELKKTQLHLSQSGKLAAIGTMAAGVAHELNNPLTIVMGFSEILTKELDKAGASNEKTTKCIGTITKSANRMKVIINHLREFSRNSEAQAKDLISPNKIIDNALILLRTSFKDSNVRIDEECTLGISDFYVNANKIESVVQNLISNAKDAFDEYTPTEEKFIRVSTQEQDGNIIIEVEDNGKGIPEKNLNEIFDPFFTTKDPDKGTGLGLSLSYTIIKEHKGTITVKSVVGEGTKFIVTIPIGTKIEVNDTTHL